ncbi:uncharacterized protein LOC130805823 [Amaranthus tricolor]|uniref:uncharacterized protein LOC130805823 n=1 Tax=Amaranthus tricolor TaxID=29722 RepID=UPI00258A2733|nr:uncharacterized protein LOC130805823 [Amaranthus tricolor]
MLLFTDHPSQSTLIDNCHIFILGRDNYHFLLSISHHRQSLPPSVDRTHRLPLPFLPCRRQLPFPLMAGAAESSMIALPYTNLQKDNQLISPLSTLLSEAPNRKRRRTNEESSSQELFSVNGKSLGFSVKNPSLEKDIDVSWPKIFTFQSTGANKSVVGFEAKQSSLLVHNQSHLPREVTFEAQRNVSNAHLLDVARKNVGNERKDKEKFPDFSKEVENAINRIESLIPSLQKLVNSAHLSEQKSVGNVALPNVSGSANSVRKEKGGSNTRNEPNVTANSTLLGGNLVSMQARQAQARRNLPVSSRVKWSRNVKFVDDDNSNNDDVKCLNLNMTRKMVDRTQNRLLAQNNVRMKNLELEKNADARASQIPRPKPLKAGMGGPDSLKCTPGRSRSFASQNSEQIQDFTILPRQSYHEEDIEEEVKSKHSTQIPSLRDTSFIRHSSKSNLGNYNQQWSQNHTIGRIAREKGLYSDIDKSRDSVDRNTVIRKAIPREQISEETDWSSSASCSAITEQSSGSPSSSSGTYESFETVSNDSDESEPQPTKLGRSTRIKHPEVTESTASDYDDTSFDESSLDDQNYSDTAGSSSQMSSARYHKWNTQMECGKRRVRGWRRLGKKLGMIFHHHHHHHHHHHYSDKDESDAHHARSFWKILGGIFDPTRNTDHRQTPTVKKSKKSEVKTIVKRKDQGRSFHTLVGGFMKHMKHSKKPKKVKNGNKGIGNSIHKGKKEGGKLPWWPKINRGRGGVKVANKGKVKCGNYYRTKSMAAAKIILGK